MKLCIIILAGVAGSGKTTVGRLLASTLAWEFIDADDFHSPENLARMRSGTALTEDDRRPWLDSLVRVVRGAIADRRPTVLACSSLGRAHRQALRVDPLVEMILIHVQEEDVLGRLRGRTGHFFNPALVRSQFEALELPAADEPTTVIDGNRPPEQIVEGILGRLDLRGRLASPGRDPPSTPSSVWQPDEHLIEERKGRGTQPRGGRTPQWSAGPAAESLSGSRSRIGSLN